MLKCTLKCHAGVVTSSHVCVEGACVVPSSHVCVKRVSACCMPVCHASCWQEHVLKLSDPAVSCSASVKLLMLCMNSSRWRMPARCRAQKATHGAWVRECMELASATGSQVNDDDKTEGGVMQATATSFLSSCNCRLCRCSNARRSMVRQAQRPHSSRRLVSAQNQTHDCTCTTHAAVSKGCLTSLASTTSRLQHTPSWPATPAWPAAHTCAPAYTAAPPLACEAARAPPLARHCR
jgi:hypothetical protein